MAYRDRLKVTPCLFKVAARHRTIKVMFRCQHIFLFEPHGLWWRFERLGSRK